MPQPPTAPRPRPGNGPGAPPRPPWIDRPGPPAPWPPAGGPLPVPRPGGAPRPAPGSPPPGGTDTVTVTTEEPKKPGELTITKVLAGAGAAATTAVLGSFFGADGTIYGAAFGSVASTVATTVYQRSLDRTRQTLVARVRVRRPGDPADSSELATVRLPRPPADGSPPDVQPDVPARSRPRWLLWVGATALVFVIAMIAITGIELAKGSTITGNDSGTSVGRAVAPPAQDPAPAEESGSADTSTTEAPSTTDPESSTTATPDPDAPGATEQDTQQQDEQQTQGDQGGGTDSVAPTGGNTPRSSAPVAPKAGVNG